MPLRLKRYPKRSPHWYLRGSVRGQNVFETTGTDDEEAADAIRIKREAQLLERSVFGPGASVAFGEAVVSYLDHGGEARFLGNEEKGIIARLARTALVAINQDEVDETAKALHPKAGPATRRRMVYVPIIAVLNHSAERGWINPPKIKLPKVPRSEPKWATPEWLSKLLPELSPSLRRLVLVMTYTGARLSEALRLTWEGDINLPERTIIFTRTKNGKMRSAHIPDTLLIELASVPSEERRGPLFQWSDKCHVHKPLRNACKRAKIPYLTPHQLGRHTFATWLRLYGKRDLRGLMQDGGWDSIASVARYAHTVPGETAAAVALMPNVQNPCSSNLKPAKDRRIRRKTA